MDQQGTAAVPARITFVTLAAEDVEALRRFYRSWGWQELPDGSAEFAQFELENTRFALCRSGALHAEAAPDLMRRAMDAWSGVTLAVNVGDRAAVDATYAAAVDAGAAPVTRPQDRDWGGYSGYVADPEHNRWEIAWLPGLLDD